MRGAVITWSEKEDVKSERHWKSSDLCTCRSAVARPTKKPWMKWIQLKNETLEHCTLYKMSRYDGSSKRTLRSSVLIFVHWSFHQFVERLKHALRHVSRINMNFTRINYAVSMYMRNVHRTLPFSFWIDTYNFVFETYTIFFVSAVSP